MLSGQKAGRDTDAQITFFDSVGFAMEDFSALRYVYDLAQSMQLGSDIALIPQLADPKDLYQLIKPVTQKTAHASGGAKGRTQTVHAVLEAVA